MTAPSPAKSAPERIVLEGRFVRLEPLEQRHAAGLFAVSTLPGGPERYRWLFSEAPQPAGRSWKAHRRRTMPAPTAMSPIIDQRERQAPWASRAGCAFFPSMPRSRSAASIGACPWPARRWLPRRCILFARHAFDDLGYRRFEWKCNNRNAASKAAATRFGFQYEGLFRQDRSSRAKAATPPGSR